MLIPCDAPLAEVVSAYLEAGDFTSSSRATDRRVFGELGRDLGQRRLADSIGADKLAAWFVRARDTYAPATWKLGTGPGARRSTCPRSATGGCGPCALERSPALRWIASSACPPRASSI